MNWLELENARTLEEQIKFNIANNYEIMMNALMTEDETFARELIVNYVHQEMQKGFVSGDMVYTNRESAKHLNFYGTDKTKELIRKYVEHNNPETFYNPETKNQEMLFENEIDELIKRYKEYAYMLNSEIDDSNSTNLNFVLGEKIELVESFITDLEIVRYSNTK